MKNILLIFLCLICLFNSIKAQEFEYAEPYLIKSIYFGGGSYYIDGQQIKELSEFLDGIPNLDQYEINVHGHTDNIGSKDYNQWLSEMRSQKVLEQILLKNIPSDIILIQDFGEENPLYNNDKWQGKLHNRRVDVIIKPIVL